MTSEAQGAVERAAEVLAAHHVAVTTSGQSHVKASWFTCTCGERGLNYFDSTNGQRSAMAEGDRHVLEALATANLLATPPTASHDETAETWGDWLGAMDEARNVFDITDEATTVISIDVEELARRLAARAAAGAGAGEGGGGLLLTPAEVVQVEGELSRPPRVNQALADRLRRADGDGS